MVRTFGTILVTAVLTSAFWIFYYNVSNAPAVALAGEKVTVSPSREPPVTVAEGVTVAPAGLAIPVIGIKANDLSDTYTQARAGGARRQDAIDIMAPTG